MIATCRYCGSAKWLYRGDRAVCAECNVPCGWKSDTIEPCCPTCGRDFLVYWLGVNNVMCKCGKITQFFWKPDERKEKCNMSGIYAGVVVKVNGNDEVLSIEHQTDKFVAKNADTAKIKVVLEMEAANKAFSPDEMVVVVRPF